MHLFGPFLSIDSKGSTANYSLSSKVARTADLNFYDEGSFGFAGRLLNEPSEVPDPDKSFYQEL